MNSQLFFFSLSFVDVFFTKVQESSEKKNSRKKLRKWVASDMKHMRCVHTRAELVTIMNQHTFFVSFSLSLSRTARHSLLKDSAKRGLIFIFFFLVFFSSSSVLLPIIIHNFSQYRFVSQLVRSSLTCLSPSLASFIVIENEEKEIQKLIYLF